jgi:hypothetical protein
MLGIIITESMRHKLQAIALWSKIAAVAGFTGLGVNLATDGYTLLKYMNFFSISTVGSLVSLAISFFVNYTLIQFSMRLKTALDNDDQEMLPLAIIRLRDYMRLLGIFLIVSIVITAVTYFFIFSRF